MEFRERLREIMAYHNMKTQELADKSGVNKRTIDHYLMSNSQEPSVSKAVKIAKALDVSVEYLVTGKAPVDTAYSREIKGLIHDFQALPPRQKSAVAQIVHLLAEPFVRANQAAQEEPGQEFSY